MINLGESMSSGRDRTREPRVCTLQSDTYLQLYTLPPALRGPAISASSSVVVALDYKKGDLLALVCDV